MVLENLKKKPTPHPSKETFKKFKIPLSGIARAIDRSYNHTANILNGNITVPQSIDEKLRELARKLEEEAEGE